MKKFQMMAIHIKENSTSHTYRTCKRALEILGSYFSKKSEGTAHGSNRAFTNRLFMRVPGISIKSARTKCLSHNLSVSVKILLHALLQRCRRHGSFGILNTETLSLYGCAEQIQQPGILHFIQ